MEHMLCLDFPCLGVYHTQNGDNSKPKNGDSSTRLSLPIELFTAPLNYYNSSFNRIYKYFTS